MSIFPWNLPINGVNNFGPCEFFKSIDEKVSLSCRKRPWPRAIGNTPLRYKSVKQIFWSMHICVATAGLFFKMVHLFLDLLIWWWLSIIVRAPLRKSKLKHALRSVNKLHRLQRTKRNQELRSFCNGKITGCLNISIDLCFLNNMRGIVCFRYS